jgi:hypothetical protein
MIISEGELDLEEAQKAWDLLRKNRPQDPKDDTRALLLSMGFSQTVISLLADDGVEKQPCKEAPVGGPIHNYRHPTPKTPFPVGRPWTKVHTEGRIRAAWEFSAKFANTLTDEVKNHFVESYSETEAGYLSNGAEAHLASLLRGRGVLKDFSGVFNGRPREYAAFVFLVNAITWIPVRKPFVQGYKSLTGKACDSRLPEVFSWYVGNPPPLAVSGGQPASKVVRKAEIEPVETAAPPVPVQPGTDLDLESSVESNTNAILEVMEDLSAHKSEVQGVCDRLRQSIRDQSQTITALESKLAEAIKAGFDPRTNLKLAQMEKRITDLLTTQLQNHKHDINRTLGERVAALESGITVDREGVDEWEERFEQVREEIRQNKDTFDTLSAQWSATDDVSGWVQGHPHPDHRVAGCLAVAVSRNSPCSPSSRRGASGSLSSLSTCLFGRESPSMTPFIGSDHHEPLLH